MKFFRHFIIQFFLIYLFHTTVLSEVIKNVKIDGNKFIQIETLLSKIEFIPGKNYNENELNEIQKKLFKTGFFKQVSFNVQNNTLYINVKENPLVDVFYIYGDKNKDRVEKIYDQVELKSGNLFSDYKLLNDISKISDMYKFSGYYNVLIEPLVKEVGDNKVNVSIKITKNDKFKIKKIFFIGDKVFSASDLLNEISSSEDGKLNFFSTTSLLNEERISYDKYLLRNFYLNEGYYDFQILTSKIDILEDNYANILFSVDSGKKYYFGNTVFENVTYFKKNIKEKLFSLSRFVSNSVYSKKKVSILKDKIFDFLVLNKFENFEFKIVETKNNNNIDIKVVFVEKTLPVVKNITVKGNSITEEKVLRNALLFSEGDSISDYKIFKSEDNIKALGIFRNTKISKIPISDKEIKIEIEVEEQPTGSIMGGVGFGTNEAAISFSIQERNLFGRNITANSTMSIGTDKIQGNLLLINPDYNDTGRAIKNNFFIEDTKYDSVGYESSMFGDDLSTQYELYENTTLNVGVGFDYDKIETLSSASNIYKSQAGNYSTYKTFYGISNDKRNKKFNTTDGHVVGFNQTIAIPVSDISYIRNNIYGKYYHAFTKDYILNFRTGFSTINAYDNNNVKLSNRLFLYNSQLRGFEPRGIGPVEANEHVGGNYSYYGGLSSTFPNPLPDRWNAKTVVFLDAGNVWGVDYDSSKDSDKIRSSYGLGLDWTSPLGPISFVLSDTLSKASTDKDQKFSFQIGSVF